MEQWGFFFNQDRCVGCKACTLACKNWNEERRGDAKTNIMNMESYVAAAPASDTQIGGAEPEVHINYESGYNNYALYGKYYMKENWRRVSTIEEGATVLNSQDQTFDITTERRYLSVSCNHCDNPVCVTTCPMGNIYKDVNTGIVLVSNNCISCGRCKQACPWDAPQFYDKDYATYPASEEKRPRMTKCNMCIDRINEGKKPACVAACWNRALDAGPVDWLRNKYTSAPFNYTLKTSLSSDFPANTALGPNIIFKEKTMKTPDGK